MAADATGRAYAATAAVVASVFYCVRRQQRAPSPASIPAPGPSLEPASSLPSGETSSRTVAGTGGNLTTASVDDSPGAVLAFWFGTDVAVQYSSLWFAPHNSAQQREADAAIQRRFGPLLAQAEGGQLVGWRGSAEGLLALIIVLDQFSRHIYRGHHTRGRTGGEPNDALALGCAEEMLGAGWEAGLGEFRAPAWPVHSIAKRARDMHLTGCDRVLCAHAQVLPSWSSRSCRCATPPRRRA